jgi:protoporphyrinogen/coproporphyrinogen III oxidase
MKKEVAVLGAGISGLSLSWFLKKKYGDRLNITIIEKSPRMGGWIQTQRQGGFLFEQGPRSCRTKDNGLETLKLIEELHLQNEIITADLAANKRYLYRNNQLVRLPNGILDLLLSPYLKKIMRALWNDWHTPKGNGGDESIYDFIGRRFSPDIAEELFDPLVSGIYAGDIRALSVRSCFPILLEWEQNHGGMIKALLFKKKKEKSIQSTFVQNIANHSIFTFKEGMERLPLELARQIKAEFMFETEAVSLKMQGNKVNIRLLNGLNFSADHVFSTLPAHALSKLIKDACPEAEQILRSIPYTSVAAVNLGYQEDLLQQKGFGYLIPSKEKEEALGVVWDSSVFPQQQNAKHTCLTVMLGGTHNPEIGNLNKEELLKQSLDVVSKHLNIKSKPTATHVTLSHLAIPQYLVGHQDKLDLLQSCISRRFPLLTLHGSYFAVSVNDCIANSRRIVEAKFHKRD